MRDVRLDEALTDQEGDHLHPGGPDGGLQPGVDGHGAAEHLGSLHHDQVGGECVG